MRWQNKALNAKSRPLRRDFYVSIGLNLFGRFDQGSDAASAQCFANHPAILINGNLLQVWFEFPIGRPHGVTSIMTEGGLFSTILTNRHDVVLSHL
jgi:hypothetical protein